MTTRLFFIVLTFICTGCWQYDNDTVKLPGNYNITWIDNMRWQTIMYNSSGKGGGWYVIEPYVFSVGYNESFIVAKQHPLCEGYLDSNCMPDQSVTNYFIINATTKDKFGPFDERTFIDKKKELNISEINFKYNFPEIPHD